MNNAAQSSLISGTGAQCFWQAFHGLYDGVDQIRWLHYMASEHAEWRRPKGSFSAKKFNEQNMLKQQKGLSSQKDVPSSDVPPGGMVGNDPEERSVDVFLMGQWVLEIDVSSTPGKKLDRPGPKREIIVEVDAQGRVSQGGKVIGDPIKKSNEMGVTRGASLGIVSPDKCRIKWVKYSVWKRHFPTDS